MRTKVLFCAAALAVSLASSMAQVYSLNVVGYYNVTIPQNAYYMVANQLNTTNNEIQYVVPNPQDYTVMYKFIGGGYQATTFYGTDLGGSGWDNGGIFTLNPGETAFVQDPGTPGGQTLTFVGTVLQGVLSNNIPASGNVVFRSAMIPVMATLDGLNGATTGAQGTVGMAAPADDYDVAYAFIGGGFQATTYYGTDLGGNGWDYDGTGAGPVIQVGEGFAYQKALGNPTTAWVINFTIQ